MQPLDFNTNNTPDTSAPTISVKDIAKHCRNYEGADAKRSIFQLVTTLVLFFALCGVMLYSLQISYGLTLLLSIPAAGLLTRIFIFQHDCGHGSFFKSKRTNDWVGRFISMLTFTPYDFWKRAHNKHHATSGGLDRRSIGGIDTITVAEYKAFSKSRQRAYRIYRNPVFLLLIGSPIYTLIIQRFPFNKSTGFYENYQTLPVSSIWKSVVSTNICLAAFYGAFSVAFGLGAVAAVYLPVVILTTWIGGWLFFIQHQFEETYWEKNENWDVQEAALMGSSYYALPKVVQWFTGNIGIHHVHHLSSKIPNYKLQQCIDDEPVLQDINKMTFMDSLKCIDLQLWDEQTSTLIPISAAA